MIAIVGYLKIDESKLERIKYLIACIRSYLFLKDHCCEFIIGLDSPSEDLRSLVYQELIPFSGKLICFDEPPQSYGQGYCNLLRWTKSEYVLNFMEDQFMVCDSDKKIQDTISIMKEYGVDICKASFWQVERNSISRVETKYQLSLGGEFVFVNGFSNFKLYQQYYKSRYYIGCNFLTTRRVAFKFWNRSLGYRPHRYEVANFDSKWSHIAMVPGIELQAAIDDDHGEPDTCLLKRIDCKKWNEVWRQVVLG